MFAYELWDVIGREIRAYEHEVSMTLPSRRYNPASYPKVIAESPSLVVLGGEERHGTSLEVRRVSYVSKPSGAMVAEMLGDLTEAWVQMTFDTSPDPV